MCAKKASQERPRDFACASNLPIVISISIVHHARLRLDDRLFSRDSAASCGAIPLKACRMSPPLRDRFFIFRQVTSLMPPIVGTTPEKGGRSASEVYLPGSFEQPKSFDRLQPIGEIGHGAPLLQFLQEAISPRALKNKNSMRRSIRPRTFSRVEVSSKLVPCPSARRLVNPGNRGCESSRKSST